MLLPASPGGEEGQRVGVKLQPGVQELPLHSLAQRARGILHHQLHVQSTVDVEQHVSDGSHVQVSIYDSLGPSGRLIIMEFVVVSLEGQEGALPRC